MDGLGQDLEKSAASLQKMTRFSFCAKVVAEEFLWP